MNKKAIFHTIIKDSVLVFLGAVLGLIALLLVHLLPTDPMRKHVYWSLDMIEKEFEDEILIEGYLPTLTGNFTDCLMLEHAIYVSDNHGILDQVLNMYRSESCETEDGWWPGYSLKDYLENIPQPRETEYSSIQAIIEELPDYQYELESWGYRVSVLPKMTREPDNAGLMRYYWKSAGPVLILEEQNGGMYCFYYGFDQYISERTYKENMMLFPVSQYDEKEYEDIQKTVRLQICKKDIRQEPLFENTADADSKARYDVSVCIEITAESLTDGNELSVFGGGVFETNYCSNNFEECRLWNGIDPESANSYSDYNIKREYSAAQLLEYYRQGLELQSRLIELYRERQGEDGG